MTGALARELAGWPGALDLYTRRAASVVRSRRGRAAARTTRIEAGSAVRERLPDGSLGLTAWTGTTAFAGPVAWPEEPRLPEASDAGADLRLQRSRIDAAIARPGRPPLTWAWTVTIATLSLPSAGGLLARTRIGEDLDPARIAADLAALATARDLAAQARAIPTPRRVDLAAAVAARVLALLWVRHRSAAEPLLAAGAAELVDAATPGGGPLGASFDDEGEATRRIVLAGDGAGPQAALGSIRPSFADLPLREPRNLRLFVRAMAAAPDFAALELCDATPAAGAALRFDLLGREAGGSAARVTIELDLPAFLAAVAGGSPGGSGETWWTPAIGAVGSPAIGLDLVAESPGSMRYSAP
jgi:hypothetical protein